jgi:hypothetical protein
MFQIDVVDRTKTHLNFNNFFRIPFDLLDNVGKYGTARQVTEDSKIWRRKDAICLPDN